MVKVIIATGYDSYNNKQVTKAFIIPSEAEAYIVNLTNPNIVITTGKSYIDVLNYYLK